MTQASPDQLDISSCASEPIRTPGGIQPHGFMLTLSPALDVLQASANLLPLAGLAAEAAIGLPLAAVIGKACGERMARELATDTLGQRPMYLGTVTLGNGRHFDVIGHVWDGLVIAEFEAVDRAEPADFRHLYPLITDFLAKVGEHASIPALTDLAARHIRSVTGYGRVMVYQFDPDGHGHVAGRSQAPTTTTPIWASAFPASDIPRQARELYLSSPHPPDPGCRLHAVAAGTGRSIRSRARRNDLSFAALRSVSPVHLQYMRNMGTLASMSVSLIVKGKLWGLISCHNAVPCAVSVRKAHAPANSSARSWRCASRAAKTRDELQFRLDVRRIMVDNPGRLTKSADFIDNCAACSRELLRFARAGGVAIVVDDRMLHLRRHAGRRRHSRPGRPGSPCMATTEVFHTDQLAARVPAGRRASSHNASGLLAHADLAHPPALPAVVPARSGADRGMGRQSVREGSRRPVRRAS